MTLLEEKCLSDPDVLEEPAAYHRALQERPIHFDPRLGFYVCSTYDLMREILRNTEVFSSVESQTTDSLRPPPAEVLALRRSGYPSVDTLVTNDPPAHTRIREMVEPLGMMASDERLVECARLIREFQDFMSAELEARRRQPRSDLLTHLVTARNAEGKGFTMAEMLSLTQQFLVAGNETTTNAIAAGVQLLVEHPEQAAHLAARGDEAMLRTFANEVLRLESPVQGLFRVVGREVEIGGVTGIHHCIGANLAREELVQTFDILLARAQNFATCASIAAEASITGRAEP